MHTNQTNKQKSTTPDPASANNSYSKPIHINKTKPLTIISYHSIAQLKTTQP